MLIKRKSMRKIKNFFNTSNRYYVFCYGVMAQSYNFSLMIRKWQKTLVMYENGDSAYAGVNVRSLSYPSATIKFKAYKQGKEIIIQ